MTPAQIKNLKETIEDNLDYLDGYDELGPELQGKVERALKEGHVDDSDWCGVCVQQSYKSYGNANLAEDVDQNRPGEKGVRISASKKKQMTENNEVSQLVLSSEARIGAIHLMIVLGGEPRELVTQQASAEETRPS